MKKKQFVVVLVVIIALIIMTFILQTLFNDRTSSFGASSGAFFMSTFCLVCYNNALKPTGDWGPNNPTKGYYEKKGELNKYQNLCKILFVITVTVGTLLLLRGGVQTAIMPLFK